MLIHTIHTCKRMSSKMKSASFKNNPKLWTKFVQEKASLRSRKLQRKKKSANLPKWSSKLYWRRCLIQTTLRETTKKAYRRTNLQSTSRFWREYTNKPERMTKKKWKLSHRRVIELHARKKHLRSIWRLLQWNVMPMALLKTYRSREIRDFSRSVIHCILKITI